MTVIDKKGISILGINSVPTRGIRHNVIMNIITVIKSVFLLWVRAYCRNLPYFSLKLLKNISNFPCCEVSPLFLNNVDASIGTKVKAINREAKRAKDIVRARLLDNLPAMPAEKIRGINTETVVSVEAVIAIPTSVVPCIAASFLLLPSSIFRYMFSITTIELSTNIPTPRAIPARVIMLRV